MENVFGFCHEKNGRFALRRKPLNVQFRVTNYRVGTFWRLSLQKRRIIFYFVRFRKGQWGCFERNRGKIKSNLKERIKTTIFFILRHLLHRPRRKYKTITAIDNFSRLHMSTELCNFNIILHPQHFKNFFFFFLLFFLTACIIPCSLDRNYCLFFLAIGL